MDKQEFFAANQPKIHQRQVTGAGGTFNFRELSSAARDAISAVARKDSATVSEYEAAVVIASVVDEQGNPVFSAEDTDGLIRDTSSVALTALAAAAAEVCGFGAASVPASNA